MFNCLLSLIQTIAPSVSNNKEIASIFQERFLKTKSVNSGVYQTLEKKGGYKIGSVVENIGASVANENEARLLSVKKGEPLVTRRQVTELNDHYPFEYVRASYVAERFEFTFEK